MSLAELSNADFIHHFVEVRNVLSVIMKANMVAANAETAVLKANQCSCLVRNPSADELACVKAMPMRHYATPST